MKSLSAWSVIGVAAVYLATLSWLPMEGHWIVDNGNKLIQVQALAASGHVDYSIPWPGRDFDPQLEHNPLPAPFSVVHKDRLYSVFSPAFPALVAPLYAAFGNAGLYLIPFLASLVLLLGLLRMASAAQLANPVGPMAVLIAGLATPIWFYSVVFWEHIVAACLAVWSVALLLEHLEKHSPRSLAASGILCAAAIAFRDQLLLFALVLGLALLVHSPGRRLRAALLFGTALGIGLIPLAVFQYVALGDPLGFHLTHGFSNLASVSVLQQMRSHLLDRPQVIYYLWLALADSPWVSLLLALPFLCFLWIVPPLPRRSYVGLGLVVSLWGLVSALAGAADWMGAPSPMTWLQTSNGFYLGAPILFIGLLRQLDAPQETADWRARRRLFGIVAIYALLYTIATPLRNATGLHWGNRYLLILYPLLSVLCAANLVDIVRLIGGTRRFRLAPLPLVVLASIGLQLQSLNLLQRKKDFTARLSRLVAEQPEKSIVTDQWWIPQTLASEFFDRKIFLVEGEQPAGRLYKRLLQAGESRILFITSAVGTPLAPGAVVVGDDGLNLFSVQIVSRPTRSLAGAATRGP